MANEIVVIEVGTPGPPGANITTAEKNALAPKASPTFTGTVTAAALTATGTVNTQGNTNLGNSSGDVTTVTGQLAFSGSSPSIAAGASAGTGATASILYGNDTQGELQINMGTGAGTGIIATITFAVARPNTNYSVFICPADSDASDLSGKFHCLNTDRSTTVWKIRASVAPTSSASHVFDYFVIG